MALGSAALAMPQYCFCETPRMDEPFFIGPSERSLELRHPAAERRLSFQNFFGPPEEWRQLCRGNRLHPGSLGAGPALSIPR